MLSEILNQVLKVKIIRDLNNMIIKFKPVYIKKFTYKREYCF
jgi:hypothetical protein